MNSVYRLCDRPISQFDPHLNLKQLNQILASLISIWKDNQYKIDPKKDIFKISKGTEKNEDEDSFEELEASLRTFSVNEYEDCTLLQASSVIEELECMYLLVNLGNQETLSHGLEVPAHLR